MGEEKKEMTQEEAEKDFKNKIARVFMDKIPGSYVDEDGFICIPESYRLYENNEFDEGIEPNMDNAADVRFYVVTENGELLDEDILDIAKKPINKKGWRIRYTGMGSEYNKPGVLLDQIKEHYEEAIVFAWDVIDGKPQPMYFVDPFEIDLLIGMLENAGDDEDSWDICRSAHKSLRSKE